MIDLLSTIANNTNYCVTLASTLVGLGVFATTARHDLLEAFGLSLLLGVITYCIIWFVIVAVGIASLVPAGILWAIVAVVSLL